MENQAGGSHMISFDFEYYKPTTIQQAVQFFQHLRLQGKKPVYYGGGTEIISMARLNYLSPKAVVDIKGITECHVMGFQPPNQLVLGAALTLTQVSEANWFPLLGKATRGIADHTIRNKITLGGNICGRIIYREAVLPFLLTDSLVVLAGPTGIRTLPIHQVFNEYLHLGDDEFLVQIMTDRRGLDLPSICVKKTKLEIIDYPLVTIAALKKEGKIRAAFSGVCAFPFRSMEIEQILNKKQIPRQTRVEQVISHLPASVLNDIQGSAGYRKFVLQNTLLDILEKLEGERQ
jgi:CO/xanthine dehydrogenase FAD-binding subunit